MYTLFFVFAYFLCSLTGQFIQYQLMIIALEMIHIHINWTTTNNIFVFTEEEGPSKLEKPLQLGHLWYHLSAFPQFLLSSYFTKEMMATLMFPHANTCVNCIKLPLHVSYQLLEEKFDFAFGNTYGFGRAWTCHALKAWNFVFFLSVSHFLCLSLPFCLSQSVFWKKFKTRQLLVSFLNAVCSITDVLYIVSPHFSWLSQPMFNGTFHILTKLSFNIYLFRQLKCKQLNRTYALSPFLWLTLCLLFVYQSVCLSDVSVCFSLCLFKSLSLFSCLWMFVPLNKCLSCSFVFRKMFYKVLYI